jgi:hypothetical protein
MGFVAGKIFCHVDQDRFDYRVSLPIGSGWPMEFLRGMSKRELAC